MTGEVARQTEHGALFRQSAVKAAGFRLLGSVTVVTPPSAIIALAISIASLAALLSVTIIVEVPMRTRADGVIMPAGGFLNIVAVESGLVTKVYVADGQSVRAGSSLVDVSADTRKSTGESLSQLNVQSLKGELRHLDDAHTRRSEIERDRVTTFAAEYIALVRQRDIGKRRYQSHLDQLLTIETRLTRLQELADKGHVSQDSVDRERSDLLGARSIRAELEQQRIAIETRIDKISASRKEAEKQIDVLRAEHALRKEQLQREIERSLYIAEQSIRASVDSIVAKVLVSPGVAVRKGQVLAKLYRSNEVLEAWLYLSTSSARLLRHGQSVQLLLDAYPKEVFGTRAVSVSSVSGIALKPSEVAAPLAINGPVFEVKAILQETTISAYGSVWPVSPGTSFKANVIQRRLHLYEWLLRSLVGEPAVTRA